MDHNFVFGHTCFCGRTFAYLSAYHKHQKTCKKGKKRLSLALEMAQENTTRKRKVIMPGPGPSKLKDIDQNVTLPIVDVEPGSEKEVSSACLRESGQI
jgi:hypothetical protein